MDLIKFTNPTDPLKMESAVAIPTPTSVMWVERYRDAGEFEIKAPLGSGLRQLLPTGTIISHMATDEVMIVENHGISVKRGSESEITISGRSLETIFEQRVLSRPYKTVRVDGSNNPTAWAKEWTFPFYPDLTHLAVQQNQDADYYLQTQVDWPDVTAKILLEDYILPPANPQVPSLNDDTDDFFKYLEAINQANLTGSAAGGAAVRYIKVGQYVYDVVIEFLKGADLGIKTIRPNVNSPLTSPRNLTHTAISIHAGSDKSTTVRFAAEGIDVESVEYLQSLKSYKNVAYVVGRWMTVLVNKTTPWPIGLARRDLIVDGTIIDGQYNTSPVYPANTEPGATNFKNFTLAMEQIGRDEIARSRKTNIVNIQFDSFTATGFHYRTDFNVGDIVTVTSEYADPQKMRVTEFVEIEDASGAKSYPTLVPYP